MPRQSDHVLAAKIARGFLILAVFFALVNIYPYGGALLTHPPALAGGVSPGEARFTRARQELLRQEVSLAGCWGESEDKIDFDFALVQLYLAPVVLNATTNELLVVGNFPQGPPANDEIAKKNLTLVRDFGQGVMIFDHK